MAGDELARRGWHLTSEGQEQCTDNGNKSADAIVKNALNLDLRDIGEKWLPTGLNAGRAKVDYVVGPAVLQILKLRNLSAPKDNEESQAAPRLWKITLTDGHANMVAICLEPLRNLNVLTPPGSKLLLEGTVDVESSYLLLTNKNARLLGGRVPSLVESWELKRKLAQQSRLGIQSEGGPPPFVPFGKKIATVEAPRRDNFKSLAASKQTKEEDDSEFLQQRQATIAEALTVKAKTFGGGQKPFVNDRDVAHIVEMGFSPDQASNALRQCGGNVSEAIGSLLGGRDRDGFGYGRGGRGGGMGGGRGGGGGYQRDRGDYRQEEDRDDSRRGGRGGRRGRGDRGGDEEEPMSSRPSGPATLFDFLENKIPSKSETHQASNSQKFSSSSVSNPKSSSSNQTVNQRPQTASNGSYTPRGLSVSVAHPPPPQHPAPSYRSGGSSYRESPNSSRSSDSNHNNQSSDSGYRSSDHSGGGGRDSRGGGGGGNYHNDDFNPGRRQQNLPPRLANKMGRDGGGFQGAVPSRPVSSRGGPDHSHDNRTRYGGGGDTDHPNADHTNRRVLREHYPDNRGSNYAGGRSDAQQSFSHPRQMDPAGYSQAGVGQRSYPDKQRQYQQQGPRRQDGPPRPVWRRGQTVLAKYWEDDQLYRAVVEAVAENGATAVVTFLDYGNQEEVLCSDIHPFPPTQNWNNSYPPPPPPPQGAPLMSTPGFFPGYGPGPGMMAPPPFPGQEGFGSGPIPNMEFRRGGSGPAHRRQEQPERRRPTQNFYTPPSRKKEG
ncbi:tudor domain-containing protein 3-like [Babylonia areolata]|uniref:tudor domain-containing protein 3-like n=1 Tax=Babylonia areolata TaxID=304850 RepID=UPI003FD1FD42